MAQTIEQLIEIAKQTGELDLSNRGLTAVPEQIREVNGLRVLILGDLYFFNRWILNYFYRLQQDLTLGESWFQEFRRFILSVEYLLPKRQNRITQLPEWMRELTQLQVLSLSDNSLSQLPEWMRELTQLQFLDLSSNSLSQLPEWMRELTQLQVLSLSDNSLSQLPEWMRELTQLQVLDLSSNRLSQLPEWMRELTQLQFLSLSDNSLSQLPEWMRELTQLQFLSLSDNSLSQLPEWMRELTQLQVLYLRSNRLSQLPEWMRELTQLQVLDLRDNPISPPIPPEILEDWQNAPRILEYLRDPQRPLNEAKLILVGQGRVGKTSLVKQLMHDHFDPDEQTTDGINIQYWTLETDGDPVRVNIWDFGGQEIMHATHQFFLTKRSLYVLVLDNGKGEKDNLIEYWLKTIQSLGGDSPILIVGNHADQRPLTINERNLKEKYPTIQGFYETSCKTGQGIAELRTQITTAIETLPHVRDRIPEPYFAIKDVLEQDQRDYIAYDSYIEICRENKLIKETSQGYLIKLLHDLGIVICFKDDYRLEDTSVLNPEWITKGVYKIINDYPLNKEHRGILSRPMLNQILDRQRYPNDKHRFILNIMRKFELCVRMDPDTNQYLIPALLDINEPDTGRWIDTLNFEYHYEILPHSIIARFIVRTYHLVSNQTWWRTGVILKSGENRAYVKADPEDKIIIIRIDGPTHTRRDFLAAIRNTFAGIHNTFPNLKSQERLPLPDDPKVTVSYKHLLRLAELNQTTYIPEGSGRVYNIKELLDSVADQYGLREDRQEIWEAIPERVKGPLGNHLVGEGTRLVEEGRWQEGLQRLLSSIDRLKQGDDHLAYANALFQTGRTYALLSHLDKASSYYRDALRWYTHLESHLGCAQCYRGLGNILVSQGYVDKGLAELGKAHIVYFQEGELEKAEEIDRYLSMVRQALGQ